MKAVMDEAVKRTQIAARMTKIEYTENISTETHEHITVNPNFSPADFAR